MHSLERPRFDCETRKQIYQYVERHGTAARHRTRSAVDVDPTAFRAELEWLLAEGYLEDDGGTLRVGLDPGSVEAHVADGFRYSIRPARQEDFESLVDTIRDVTAEETYVVAETVAERLLYEDTVTRHNAVESRVFFVATVDGDVVGWTHLDLPQVDTQNAARLTVGVRGEYRERGVGSQLLERALDWAAANAYGKVYNSVPATNDEGLAFLESHGWETEGVRSDHYTIGDRLVDEVLMAYTL
ncbi:GNAT family N-acetyltransferase [Halobacterium yunchengense]|uniref:GNAT family N-acetyltransferase n=1 Tax=Halobacterium yunchengense TaxID=3108497 RepID=UPI003009FFB8